MPAAGMNSERSRKLKIVMAFAAIYVIWGTTYLGIRVAVETIPPFLMAGVRFAFSGALLFIVLRARGVPWPKRLHWRSAVIIGAFLLLGGNGFVTWSEQQVPSGIAALIVATMPLWMTMFDWLIFKGARPTRRIVTGLLLGLIGIALLVGPGHLTGTNTFNTFSLMIILLAPVLWSFGSLYSRDAALPENVFMSTAMEMSAGGALLLLASLLTGELTDLDVGSFSTNSLLAFLYLTIFGSIVAFTAYIWLLKEVPAAKISTYTYVNPVIAVLLGWLLLGEPVTALTVVSVPIIITAVVLITTRQQSAKTTVTVEPVLALNTPEESLLD